MVLHHEAAETKEIVQVLVHADVTRLSLRLQARRQQGQPSADQTPRAESGALTLPVPQCTSTIDSTSVPSAHSATTAKMPPAAVSVALKPKISVRLSGFTSMATGKGRGAKHGPRSRLLGNASQ